VLTKILFVALTENQVVRGVERYSIELLRHLSTQNDLEVTVLCGAWQKYFRTIESKNIRCNVLNLPNNKIARHAYLIFNMPRISRMFDVVHYANTLPVLFRNRAYTMATIHDLAEYYFPEKYSYLQTVYRKKMLKLSIRNIDHFLTVSNFSKQSISDVLQVSKDRVTCIYPGINHLPMEQPVNPISNKDQYLAKDSYFLYFGAIEKSKGIEELVTAFSKFRLKAPDFKLYLIGKPANAINFLTSKTDDHIQYLGYTSDEIVAQYARNAKAVINLSKFEGFGFPVLEAFTHNDNIISSNTTSLGEISRSFAWQVSPVDLDAIEQTMRELVAHPKKFEAEEKAKILSQFDWNKTAHEYQKLVKNLIAMSRGELNQARNSTLNLP